MDHETKVEEKATSKAIHTGLLDEEEDDVFNPYYLRTYYARLFPYNAMFRWLSYGQDPASESPVVAKDYFSRREFSFTLAEPGRDEIYIRYLSFRDESEFRAAMQERQPHKIDIGAVFTAPPDKHLTLKKETFYPVERELVFDIDLTDYDDIRTCCSGASICNRCWPFMTAAIKVMDRALREDFNFQHRLWVYSGRRGVHCWVADKHARALQDQGRSAVAEYLSVIAPGGEHAAPRKTVHASWPMEPSVERAYSELEALFTDVIICDEGQGLLGDADPSRWDKILAFLPPEGVDASGLLKPENVREAWAREGNTPVNRWRQLCTALTRAAEAARSKTAKIEIERTASLIVLAFTYPRLDINVSKTANHLLKSIFSVHPKTGRVCVPIDPARADEFNPERVSTVADLCKQLGRNTADPESGLTGTDMDGYVRTMERTFLSKLEASVQRMMRAQEKALSEKAAAATGDW